jgi:hypothetical protein
MYVSAQAKSRLTLSNRASMAFQGKMPPRLKRPSQTLCHIGAQIDNPSVKKGPRKRETVKVRQLNCWQDHKAGNTNEVAILVSALPSARSP